MADLVSREQVEAYLSLPVVVDTLDDDNNGQVDNASFNRVLTDSQAIFLASIRGTYELPLTAPIDPFVETVILQIFHCQLIKRFPERFKRGVKICDEVTELLKGIRGGDYVLAHPVRSDGFTPQCSSKEERGYDLLEGTSDTE